MKWFRKGRVTTAWCANVYVCTSVRCVGSHAIRCHSCCPCLLLLPCGCGSACTFAVHSLVLCGWLGLLLLVLMWLSGLCHVGTSQLPLLGAATVSRFAHVRRSLCRSRYAWITLSEECSGRFRGTTGKCVLHVACACWRASRMATFSPPTTLHIHLHCPVGCRSGLLMRRLPGASAHVPGGVRLRESSRARTCSLRQEYICPTQEPCAAGSRGGPAGSAP